jgi:glycine cleavage system pyridoxal-binding protein P
MDRFIGVRIHGGHRLTANPLRKSKVRTLRGRLVGPSHDRHLSYIQVLAMTKFILRPQKFRRVAVLGIA